MAEENKDLNTSQSVAEGDLNKSQSVAGTDLTASGQGDSEGKILADGTDEKKTVPYSELKKAIDEKNAAIEQAQVSQNQMNILQANQQVVQPQVQTQPLSDYDQAKADCGVADAEYLTEAERSKVQARMAEIMSVRNQHSVAALSNQQFEASHSDFGSVVGLRNPLTGQIQPTAEIQKILTGKPFLTATAYASSQGAYEIVMNERKFNDLQQQNILQEEHLKQQEIDTKLAPVSGAAAVGGAVSAQATGVITLEQQQENERKVAAGELT